MRLSLGYLVSIFRGAKAECKNSWEGSLIETKYYLSEKASAMEILNLLHDPYTSYTWKSAAASISTTIETIKASGFSFKFPVLHFDT